MHDRNLELEVARAALYEELRLLSTAQLLERAHFPGSRATLIADILEAELS